MTTVAEPATTEPGATEPEAAAQRGFDPEQALRGILRWVVAVAGALAVFGIFLRSKGVSPWSAYPDMFRWVRTGNSPKEILIKATPIGLAALAVCGPARAGLLNVGGEGQLVVGAVGAAGVSLSLGAHLPGPVVIVLMAIAAMLSGAAWAGLAAFGRLAFGISEAVSTLLLNYLAINLMAFLVYDRWKDRHGSGQPTSRALATNERLPHIWGRVHVGFLLLVIATVGLWIVFRTTRWGFVLRVVGGNAEAGRRAGLRVNVAIVSAMLIGGALAGLGGFAHYAGVEFKLRQGIVTNYGYVAFLASWLARHKPVRVAAAAVLLSAISIAGDSLQIESSLPAASVNVLMAVLLLAVFGWTSGTRKAAA